ncbi:MAG: DUF1684 domain-containing protein [Anaerolineae bacterium]
MSELDEFRQMKDEFFRDHFQSPLTAEQKKEFKGLPYYPENPDLRFELSLQAYNQPGRVQMQTSTGAVQDYIRAGQIHFEVNGEPVFLQVYQSADGAGGYFLPFVDATAPAETYGAGRYLEPEPLGGDLLAVDFNLAYNPYCAYNDRWSCPLPPAENRLTARIEAGEKRFHV